MASIFAPLQGRVWKFGDSVDTNQLASTQSGDGDIRDWLRNNCLHNLRPEFPRDVAAGDIVVAGGNFGCGSSRQTAVQALQYCGVAAVLAESVARIFRRNSIALALPTFVVPGISAAVEDGDRLEIDYPGRVVRNLRSGRELAIPALPASVEQIYQHGGIAQVIGQRLAAMGIVPGEKDRLSAKSTIPIAQK